MNQVLLYSVLFMSIISFCLAFIACARVGKILNITKDLDWANVANITGDLATLKKTIQTVNNRINGMHSPKIAEQELMMQLLAKQQNPQPNGKLVGG